MCINPIPIRNVNKGLGHIGLNFMKDCDHEFMYVPCGHCPDCVQARQSQLVQRIQAESKYNHLFFCTLTYDNKHLPVLTFEVPAVKRMDAPRDEAIIPFDFESYEGELYSGVETCVSEPLAGSYTDGEDVEVEYEEVKFPYADIHHVQLLLKNLRDNNVTGRNIRYVAVSELGKGNGRPHFHILFMLEKRPEDYFGNGRVNTTTMRILEKQLYDMVFKYWAVNVGTRKRPIYEPLFTYRRRFYGGRVNTNFDLHWVDPSLTIDGESNVAYYVSKYMMKGSDRDVKRQQFLKLNLTEEEYNDIWNTVRCRMTCSKGLGLDARFEMVDYHVEERLPLYKIAEIQLAETLGLDDLPSADFHPSPVHAPVRVVRRRVMIPNFELAQWIRSNLTRDVGESPQPIFIAPDGKHRPLAPFYKKFGFIFSTSAALEYWFNWNPDRDVDRSALPKEEKDKLVLAQAKRVLQASRNSTFDTSPVFLNPNEDVIYNPFEAPELACPSHHHHQNHLSGGVGSILRQWN